MRKIDRCYSEHTDSCGLGRPLTMLSVIELNQETQERDAENPKAYRGNVNPYLLYANFKR